MDGGMNCPVYVGVNRRISVRGAFHPLAFFITTFSVT